MLLVLQQLVNQRIQSIRTVSLRSRPQIRHALRAFRLLRMQQHRVLTMRRRKPTDRQRFRLQPSIQIIILAAPSLEHVRHPIDALKLFRSYRNGPSKQSQIRQIEPELVQAGAHVSRLTAARIQMSQTHRHQVDVMQNHARKSRAMCMLKADVEQFGPIERALVELLDQIDAIVDALLTQIVVHVDEKGVQLLFALSVHHDDGGAEEGRTVGRIVFAAYANIGRLDDGTQVRCPVHELILDERVLVGAVRPIGGDF